MALALGIDTGGTFTDSVIFDLTAEKVIAKAKASTTYDDLTRGIGESISNLTFDNFQEVKLVSLSTTMATNAIVEGRGCEVGLILIGEQPAGPLPVSHFAVVRGGHDIKGNPRDDLDLHQVGHVLDGFKDRVQAVAISGFASVRNPEHELRVKELVEHKLRLPVVCGHELTTSLGFHERTVTAVLNARLIPIVTDLIDSVKKALAQKGIDAQLMIVKGDGSLMSETLALEKPIDTILSGPAASIVGATSLTGRSEALVLDIGGTTSDIAVLKNGVPRISTEGARVGGWLTRVEAAEISTYGLGGDSYLCLNEHGKLNIGPQKVWPLSFLGARYPYLYDELEQQRRKRARIRVSDVADVYLLLRKNSQTDLSETESKALEILESGPHSLVYLAEALGKNPYSFNLDGLIKKGVVVKAAVTPTDVLHAKGCFNEWNSEIALLGINTLAEMMGKRPAEFIEFAFAEIVNALCMAILQSVVCFDGASPETANSMRTDYLIDKFLNPKDNEILHIAARLGIPIIGIGAPVASFLPEVARKLDCEQIIPVNYDVANAIGAAAGKVRETIKMTISSSSEGYVLYSQWERKGFTVLEDAKDYALKEAEKYARFMAEKAGAADCRITKRCRDVYSGGGQGPHVETIVEVTVIGRPNAVLSPTAS